MEWLRILKVTKMFKKFVKTVYLLFLFQIAFNAGANEESHADIVLLVEDALYQDEEALSNIIELIEKQLETHNSLLNSNDSKLRRKLIKVSGLPQAYVDDMSVKELGIDLSTNLGAILGKLYLGEELTNFDKQQIDEGAARAIHALSMKYGADQLILVTNETQYDTKVHGHAGQEFVIQVTTNGLMADPYLVAHEFGHVDGLKHNDDPTKLMYANATNVNVNNAYTDSDLQIMNRFHENELIDIITSPINGDKKETFITDCGCALAAHYVQESINTEFRVTPTQTELEFNETEVVALLSFEVDGVATSNNMVMKVNSGSAKNGEDFVARRNSVIEIDEGAGGFDVEIELIDDNEYEQVEQFSIEFAYGATGNSVVSLISEDKETHNVTSVWEPVNLKEGVKSQLEISFKKSGDFKYDEDVIFKIEAPTFLNLPPSATLKAGESTLKLNSTPSADGYFNLNRDVQISLVSQHQYVISNGRGAFSVQNSDVVEIGFDTPQSIKAIDGEVVIVGEITNSILSSESMSLSVESSSDYISVKPLAMAANDKELKLELTIVNGSTLAKDEIVTLELSHKTLPITHKIEFKLIATAQGNTSGNDSETPQVKPSEPNKESGSGGSMFLLLFMIPLFLTRCWKTN